MIMNDSAKRRKMQSSGDSYYLAGSYDPTSCAVSFQTGVIKQWIISISFGDIQQSRFIMFCYTFKRLKQNKKIIQPQRVKRLYKKILFFEQVNIYQWNKSRKCDKTVIYLVYNLWYFKKYFCGNVQVNNVKCKNKCFICL